MTYNRRQILQALTAGAATAATGGHTAHAQTAAATGTQAKVLEAREALWQTGVAGSNPRPVWAYNGDIPGPVLRIPQGDMLDVQLLNRLAQDTTIHWRGVRGPNAMDGVGGLTQAPVKPGERFSYRFAPPDSGTFIYHAHPAQNRAAQVHRGLSGVLVVEEKNPPETDEDIVLALADWHISGEGKPGETGEDRTQDLADARGPGRFGSLLTINGKPVPLARVARPGARLRFRIANLCPARIVALTFHGAQPTIAAIDGQACGAFAPVDRTVPAGPGARFDVFADMPAKEGESLRIVLRSWPLDGQKEEPAREIYTIRSAGTFAGKRAQPVGLPENPALPKAIPLQSAKRIELVLARNNAARAGNAPVWTINGTAHTDFPAKPLFSVKRGTPVTLAFHNRDRFPQIMRIHGHVMRLLHKFDDGWDPYWRDAVIVPPASTVRVAFIADNPGRWLLASGIHSHANAGLAHWFEID